jgi:hypothetical protein
MTNKYHYQFYLTTSQTPKMNRFLRKNRPNWVQQHIQQQPIPVSKKSSKHAPPVIHDDFEEREQ